MFKQNLFSLFFIIMLVLISRFASDIYLPSFPFIMKDFATSFKWVQFSISGYFLAVSISQFFYGFLSDRYGRKSLLFIGIILFAIGCILAIFSDSIGMFLAARVLQGIGMGASVSLPRAIMSDMFKGKNLLQASSYISIAASLGPAIAPILGGYVEHFFNWQMNFILLLLFTLFILSLAIPFQESSKGPKEREVKFFKTVFKLLKNKQFIFNAFFSFTMGGILIAYLTDSSFLFQVLLGYSAIAYGHLAVFLVIGYLIGSFLGPYSVNFLGMRKSYIASVLFLFLVAAAFLIVNSIFPLSFYTIIPCITLISVSAGLISPKALAHALDSVSQESKGAGAALIGSAPLIGGGISSFIIAHFHYRSAIPLAVLIFIFSLAAVANLSILSRCYRD